VTGEEYQHTSTRKLKIIFKLGIQFNGQQLPAKTAADESQHWMKVSRFWCTN